MSFIVIPSTSCQVTYQGVLFVLHRAILFPFKFNLVYPSGYEYDHEEERSIYKRPFSLSGYAALASIQHASQSTFLGIRNSQLIEALHLHPTLGVCAPESLQRRLPLVGAIVTLAAVGMG